MGRIDGVCRRGVSTGCVDGDQRIYGRDGAVPGSKRQLIPVGTGIPPKQAYGGSMTGIVWRGDFENAEVNALHAEGFEHRLLEDDWWARVNRHSLGWVCAREEPVPDGTRLDRSRPHETGVHETRPHETRPHETRLIETGLNEAGLVGFVNVAWDGGVHAFLLDTLVAAQARRQGIGTALVAVAARGARAAGCEWLHVDFEDHLRAFYFEAAGFTPSNAGLVAL
jgi:GNAT superfamily N-acetyltransferase